MIQSMTAFARAEKKGVKGAIICEVRSINHRFFELNVRLPDHLHSLEMPLRDALRRELKRGKVECYFRYQMNQAENEKTEVNNAVLKKLVNLHRTLAEQFQEKLSVEITQLLQWPGLLEVAELDLDELQKEFLAVLETALKDLVAARLREGQELTNFLLQRIDSMGSEIIGIKTLLPKVLVAERERLLSRFQELKLELDAARLEQETVLLIQKMDVTEELDRLETHLKEVKRVLKEGGPVGRRLDFLMQELNREANTLGSKSVNSAISRSAIELKVLIEQMREQVQNIE